jgi:diacylglycerol kinase
MKKFLLSVRNASGGIRYAWATERNIKIHLFVFMFALSAAFFLEISRIEFLLLLAISALTISLELANTAVEHLADKVSPEYDIQIGLVKDLMAGAVLVSSVFAIIIGLFIFAEPLLKLLLR